VCVFAKQHVGRLRQLRLRAKDENGFQQASCRLDVRAVNVFSGTLKQHVRNGEIFVVRG